MIEKWKIGILLGGILRLTIPAVRHHTCVRLPFCSDDMFISGSGAACLRSRSMVGSLDMSVTVICNRPSVRI